LIISISAKCGDLFNLSVGDFEYNDYVPKGMGIGGGDYIKLDIDLETGKIIGWDKNKTQKVIDRLMKND
jgi:hypothetical protein